MSAGLDLFAGTLDILDASGKPLSDPKAANLVVQTGALATSITAGVPALATRNPALATVAIRASAFAFGSAASIAAKDYAGSMLRMPQVNHGLQPKN